MGHEVARDNEEEEKRAQMNLEPVIAIETFQITTPVADLALALVEELKVLIEELEKYFFSLSAGQSTLSIR